MGRDGDSVFTTAQRNEAQSSAIRRGNIVEVDGEQEYNLFARQDESDNLTPREFLSVFQRGGFSYYVNRLIPSVTENYQIRVSRLCNNDTGREGFIFRSYFEVRLVCGEADTEPTAATYITDSNGIATSIVVSVSSSSESDTDSNTENHLCVYSLAEINENMTAKYNACLRGEGRAGLAREQTTDCVALTPEQLSSPNLNECRLTDSFLPAQEVEGTGSALSVLSQPLSGSQFSSLLHRTVDGVQFLFAGTDNGQLYQYHVNNNLLSLIHTFDLVTESEVGVANITQLTATSDGLTLYALTPNKLISHSVDVCDSYKSCDSCLGDGRDPICGWCALENRCSRQINCSAESAVWVSEGVGSCPVILSGDPLIIYMQEFELDITIDLLTSNIPDEGREYQCSYNFLSNASAQQSTSATTVAMTRSLTGAVRTGDMFTCTLPSEIPDIPNMEDALLSNLTLYHKGNDVALLSPAIRFADCSVHTTCTSCIGSESQCSWCPFTFKCIAPRVESCEGVEEAVNDSCPKLLPPSNNFLDNYLIHANYMYEGDPLIIRAENLDTFSNRFQSNEFDCVIRRGEMQLFRTRATLNQEENVVCEQQQFDHDFEDGEALLNLMLDVVWTQNNLTIDNPSNIGVTLYSCPRLGTNCAVCISLESDYSCSYCDHSCVLDVESQCNTAIDTIAECRLATISSISPTSGPLAGGTMVTVVGDNIGITRSDIRSVMIGGVSCDIIDQSYQTGVSFTCVTSSASEEGDHPISIDFEYLEELVVSSTPNIFSFKEPSLSSVVPLVGPQSGGTMVTITGTNLNIGSNLSVTLADVECYVTITDEDEVTCRSMSSELTEGVVRVAIDNWEDMFNSGIYRYVADPTVDSITPDLAFASGGTEFTIRGTSLEIVQEPRLLVHITNSQRRRRRQSVMVVESEPCTANTLGTLMTCLAPPTNILSSQRSVTIGLAMDGVGELRRIKDIVIHADPRFRMFGDQSFSASEEIRLTVESEGSKFIFTEEMVRVLVTPCSESECVCNRITFLEGNTSFTCVVGSSSGLDRGRQLTVTVHLGNYNQTVGHIELSNPVNVVLIVVPIVVVLFLLSLAVFVFVVFLFCYTTRKKDSRYNQLMVEMEKLESSVARECKLGFAELQTDLDELAGDISGHRLPYHDLKMYLLASLFPGSKDHPVLHPVQLPVHRQISSQRAIKDFHSLCMDKKVLLVFVRTLEEQRNFTIRDKSLVGSLLMVALHHRLDYATEVLKTLMSDLIHRAISKSNPKLLLRRTESVAEKMLTNWLAFCLHGYIVECAGKPLYLLYRAVKNQLEKGPIDVITGEARYSLSEHKLIRQKMDAEVLTVTVEAGDGVRVPVKVLDCDTISQVKEKLLDAVYKATPVSKRPSLTSVDLEYVKGPRDYMVLRDEDMTMESDAGWKKLNTLWHYGVVDGATFRLMKRQTHAQPGQSFDYPASLISSHAVRNRALSEAEDGTRVWHLFKQQDVEDPKRSPFMNKKMITEVYLPRMLSTKNILQKFVDDLFSSLFSVSQSPSSPVVYAQFFPLSPGTQAPMGYAPGGSVPMAVKYLLDFLDDAAEAAQMTERDVVHTWKNNALALRFWVNLMKNPEFVFDINKSHTVDACLSVIAQAFIDGCSFADVKLTIDSPTSKLLYNKEVQGYKAKVRQYYQNVARLPRIPEDAMQSYLKQLSEQQGQMFKKNGGLVVESALYELLRYGNKYSEELLANLRAAGLESRAQVFQSIVRATS